MLSLFHDDGTKWKGSADLVFTHPYGPLPSQLHGKPSIINLYQPNALKISTCEKMWMGGAKLEPISTWGVEQRNTVFVANLPVRKIDLTDLVEDTTDAPPNTGWFPIALVMRMLWRAYAMPGRTCWDGFAGRGTVGHGCVCVGMHYVGIEWNAMNYARMLNYLHQYLPKEQSHGTH